MAPSAAGALLDPCLRYFQLANTRLLAARDMQVVWLNGTYLMRMMDPSPPPPPATSASASTSAAPATVARREVVKLSHVCWLELNGCFWGEWWRWQR